MCEIYNLIVLLLNSSWIGISTHSRVNQRRSTLHAPLSLSPVVIWVAERKCSGRGDANALLLPAGWLPYTVAVPLPYCALCLLPHEEAEDDDLINYTCYVLLHYSTYRTIVTQNPGAPNCEPPLSSTLYVHRGHTLTKRG